LVEQAIPYAKAGEVKMRWVGGGHGPRKPGEGFGLLDPKKRKKS